MHYLKYMRLSILIILWARREYGVLAGVFRAGGDTKFGLICDTIDMWCYAIPLGFFACICTETPGAVGLFPVMHG